eukprot:1156198-Pelagomonas_calceolata.AAC.1
MQLGHAPGCLRMAATVPSDTDSPMGGILILIGSLAGRVDRNPRSCVMEGGKLGEGEWNKKLLGLVPQLVLLLLLLQWRCCWLWGMKWEVEDANDKCELRCLINSTLVTMMPAQRCPAHTQHALPAYLCSAA